MKHLIQKGKAHIAGFLILVVLLSVAGCGKKKENNTTEAITETTTLTSTTEITEDVISPDDPPIVPVTADPDSPEALAEQARFDEYVMESFRDTLDNDSISIHYYIVHPEDYGIDNTVASLGDAYLLTDEEIAEKRAEAAADYEEFLSFDYDLLTARQQFDYDVYNSVMNSDTYYDFYYLQEPFSYTSGLHSNMPINYSEYVFRSADDIPMYLELLAQLPDMIDNALAFEKIRIGKGYFMNRHNADDVIRQCSEFIADPDHNLLIETFDAKLDALTDLDAGLAADYKKQNEAIVKEQVIPAYQRIINFFKSNRNSGKNDYGICYLDGGKDYYKYLLANQTGTDRTPEEIISLLDQYLDDCMTELTTVAMSNYSDYMTFIDEFDNLYGEIDPADTMSFYEDIFKARFPELPPLEYTISPVHESLKNIVSPAFYMMRPIDDCSENTIRLNIESDGAGDLWSTLAHEGIPGHMYQRNYYLQTNPSPLRAILNFMGYTEGWATYVEFMSYEYYDYTSPIYADLCRLNTQLSLIVSARIEIGVNYEGWKLADVENYLSTSGFDADGGEQIMNYVIAEPANYQAYVLGWLEFEELRKHAMEELGSKFDEIEFHKTLLEAGTCPFPLLRTRVDTYISENR